MAATITTTNMAESIDTYGLLQLLQLTSPSLPIGGFAWSQGLEFAIDTGWLKNETDTVDWLQGMITHSLANLEVPLLKRLYQAATHQDSAQLRYWNQYLLASRETKELILEDTQMGAALKRLLIDIEICQECEFPPGEVAYVTCFAMAAAKKSIELKAACIGFVWGWLENQIAAALKIFPLGQTAGQRIFHQLSSDVIAAVEHGLLVEDKVIGNSMPGQVIASMFHEEQYSRLFRS